MTKMGNLLAINANYLSVVVLQYAVVFNVRPWPNDSIFYSRKNRGKN